MSDQPAPIHRVDPDGNDITIGGATLADQAAALEALQATWQHRLAVRQWLDNTEHTWALAKSVLQDFMDGIPPPPTGNLNLALVGQQIQYLYAHAKDQDRIIIGIADAVITIARALAKDLERRTDVTPP